MKAGKQISPAKHPVTWWPLLFTPFVAWVLLDPFLRHASWREWALTIAGTVVFFGSYTVALVFWYRRRIALGAMACVALLGCLFAPFNQGAAIFIIFATSFVPYATGGDIALSAGIIGLILAVVGLESWLLHLSWVFLAYSAAYAVILGTGNTYAARQAFSAERLAKLSERERIARDLHDVLGHTLSVVILKAELAGKLLDRDLERARAEISDLQMISRQALSEVRNAIRGYRVQSLQAEFEHATSTLKTAGLAVETQLSRLEVSPIQQDVLALTLREAVTNVVRHARAKNCRLHLQHADGMCRLEIQDDGRGGITTEGFGLRGMRQRVEALGGTMRYETEAGTRLTITLPMDTRK